MPNSRNSLLSVADAGIFRECVEIARRLGCVNLTAYVSALSFESNSCSISQFCANIQNMQIAFTRILSSLPENRKGNRGTARSAAGRRRGCFLVDLVLNAECFFLVPGKGALVAAGQVFLSGFHLSLQRIWNSWATTFRRLIG